MCFKFDLVSKIAKTAHLMDFEQFWAFSMLRKGSNSERVLDLDSKIAKSARFIDFGLFWAFLMLSNGSNS